MVISDNTLETIMFDYNAPDYAATAFTASESAPPEAKRKASARPTAVLRRKVSPTLVEDFAATVVKAKADGLELNPFLCGFEFDIRKGNGDQIETEQIFDADGKPVETRHTTVRYIDQQQFLKIYPELLGKLFEMKTAGIQMLAIVLNALRECDGQDLLRLRWDEVQVFKDGKPIKLSRAGFYRGIGELECLKIIAKKGNDLFWINPSFIFNGNRVTFAQRLVAKHEEQPGA